MRLRWLKLGASHFKHFAVGLNRLPQCDTFSFNFGHRQLHPIKPIGFAHDFLSIQDVDYIESFDYFESYWIKQGQREDRLIYRHYFNQHTQTCQFEMLWRCRNGLAYPALFPAS